MRPLIADITLNQEFLIWVIGPFVASTVVLVAGLLGRRQSRGTGLALIVVGGVGVILSAAWVAFLFYVDAVLGDT